MAPKPSRDTLIHCDACGEDYSSTYRRCPFCGARNDPKRSAAQDTPYEDGYDAGPFPASPGRRSADVDDGYVFEGQDAFDGEEDEEYYEAPRSRGGKRLAPKQGGGGFEMPPINWPRLITFLCSLVIIVAAMVIVFTFIYPQLRGNADKDKNKDSDSKNSAGITDTNPPEENSAEIITPAPNQGTEQSPAPVDPNPEASDVPPAPAEVTGITLTADGRTLTANDITLYRGQSSQMGAVITPSGWTGPVVWTSSNPDWFTVSDTGLVTNVNNSGSFHNAFLTVTAGGMSVRCEVRVRAVVQDPTAPQPTTPAQSGDTPPATQPPSSGGGTASVGSAGTIVGADGGLRVRSGPGTSNEILASLQNGNTVNVLEDAGNGWVKISFAGSGGTMTGYIMSEYISGN